MEAVVAYIRKSIEELAGFYATWEHDCWGEISSASQIALQVSLIKLCFLQMVVCDKEVDLLTLNSMSFQILIRKPTQSQ